MDESKNNEDLGSELQIRDEKPLDLSELLAVDFGPQWSVKEKGEQKHAQLNGHSKQGAPPPRARAKRNGRSFSGRSKQPSRPLYTPAVQAEFFPEHDPFTALIKILRSTNRTYELFTIAQLILEKPERFFTVIKPQKKDQGEPSQLYISIPDKLPFESEKEAINHILQNCLEDFFEIETVEIDPPKGAFKIINRCKSTQVLLGPPNYHRYPELLREHNTRHFPQESPDRVEKRIESVKDEALVQQWMEQMSQRPRYHWKGSPKDETQPLDSIDQVQRFLLKHHKDTIIQTCTSFRLPGTKIEQLPSGSPIASAIKQALEQQKRFPLDTANRLRTRLRKLNFTVYKKGAHGVTYICAAKRKPRNAKQVFAKPIEKLINFIEENPRITPKHLMEKYLGIPSNKKTEPAVDLEPEKQEQIKDLRQTLHWLVSEGYVIEHADGTLYSNSTQSKTASCSS